MKAATTMDSKTVLLVLTDKEAKELYSMTGFVRDLTKSRTKDHKAATALRTALEDAQIW